MTDHEEFEKWWLTKFSAEFLDSDNCWSAWTGWQARGELDAVKIKELEAELAECDRAGVPDHDIFYFADGGIAEMQELMVAPSKGCQDDFIVMDYEVVYKEI
jgi:hypothetical protein